MKDNYVSTRGSKRNITASQAIVKGLSDDGGLFVPSFLRDLNLNLNTLADLDYETLTSEIFKSFLDDFQEDDIKACIHSAYKSGKFDNDVPVALKKVGNRFFLELFHGPTAAFKDMALTLLPYLMTTAMKNLGMKEDILILTATSGDTGKAALEGFADVPHIGIIVYYPKDGVSTIQEKQMLTQKGDNTCVVGVKGNFDDTQNGVKQMLNDKELSAYLKAENICFSSANSINIGRLLPQLIYYFYSYFELVRSGELSLGDPVNFVVPTGNFGNILAGYYAHILGLPVHKFICASNQNHILTDFFQTGDYDRNRPFYKTTSPSMDILISSNLERLLYDVTGNNPEAVAKLMASLQETGHYTLSEEYFDTETIRQFYGGYADEAIAAKSMAEIYHDTDYLMDPHTAVANAVYDNYLQETGDSTPTIILSTASPYKFARAVYGNIFGDIPENMDDYQLIKALSKKTDTPIPKPLQDLDKKENQHDRICQKDKMMTCVKDFIKNKA